MYPTSTPPKTLLGHFSVEDHLDSKADPQWRFGQMIFHLSCTLLR